jgi:DNA-binding CsgD family transcriptional regulator
LRYERGRLAAATQTLTQRLHALAREAAEPHRAEGEIGGTLELPCGKNRPPLAAHVFPLAANRAVSILDIDLPAVALFVADPAAGLGAQVRRFSSRFALTGAEARVLGEIVAGGGLRAAATRLNITEATARTHIQRIFDKTETQRQTELIRRFFEIAFSASPSS